MVKKFKKVFKNQKGFTLVELLAVIVILGIIAAIAIPSIGKIIDNSKEDAHIANAQQLLSAARLAVAAEDSSVLVNDGSDGDFDITMDRLVSAGYLEGAIKDPDTNTDYTGTIVVQYSPTATGDEQYKVTLGDYITDASPSKLNQGVQVSR